MYFMKLFLFILRQYILIISMHLLRNTVQILLYLKSVCLILTHVHFCSHSNSTLTDSSPSSELNCVQYSIFSRPLNSLENKSMTIISIPAYQGCSFFFAEEEIGTFRESLSTKYSRVSTIQNLKAFKNIVEEGENNG